MNRRLFIGSVAAAGVWPGIPVLAQNSFEAPSDEFPLEKEAFEIASHLNRLTSVRSLPLAPGLRGVSPLPLRYAAVSEGVTQAEYDSVESDVEAGLAKWVEGLGEIRSARFYVLADDVVRFEVASVSQYRVGLWKQKWSGGQIGRAHV